MGVNIAKRNYKQKYQQAKASVRFAATTPVTMDVTAVNSPTPAITSATVTTALKGLLTYVFEHEMAYKFTL